MKKKPFLDHVDNYSRTVYDNPGFNLSVGEMMKLFKGCLSMTVHMEKNPIKEGFKSLVICNTVTGFILYLT